MASPILNRVKSTGVGFDCTWSSREWKVEERVIAAVAQKTGYCDKENLLQGL